MTFTRSSERFRTCLEHVYLTPVPDSTSEPSAFSSRNITSQVVVSRTTLCTLFFSPFFRQSLQSKIPTQRNHSLLPSVSVKSKNTKRYRGFCSKSSMVATVCKQYRDTTVTLISNPHSTVHTHANLRKLHTIHIK